jgi:hypothetical protein
MMAIRHSMLNLISFFNMAAEFADVHPFEASAGQKIMQSAWA